MRTRWYFIGLFTYLYFLWLINSSQAGTTGKIRGTVKDAATGAALPGVNVYISQVWNADFAHAFEGQLGAASDLNGEFIILKVPPGIYSITASMIGYTTMIRPRVRVSIDRTTRLEFLLKEEVLELGQAVVVEAHRDLIQLDVASTENYISDKNYQNTPFANRVEDVLGMQSGVEGKIIEGEITIRSGETREVALMLDGMLMVDKKFNRPVMAVNPGVVEEIKLMRNGFSAEYGQASSGMINIVTKDPESRFHFFVDYQLEPARRRHYGRSLYDPGLRWERRLMAGPRAFEGDSLFLNEGKLGEWKYWRGWNQVATELLNDNNPDNDLTAEEAFELWKWRHRPIEYGDEIGHNLDLSLSGPLPKIPVQTKFLTGFKYERHPFTYPQSRDHYDEKVASLKLLSQINPNLKVVFSGLYSVVKSVTQTFSESEWKDEDRLAYISGDASETELYYPFRKPIADRLTSIFGVKWIHTLSSHSFYEFNVNQWYIKWHIDHGPEAKPEDGRYFHGRLYYDPHSGWIPPEHGADDLATGYKMYGGAATRDNSYNQRTVFNFLFTSQFRTAHELKAGCELSYDILHQNRTYQKDNNPLYEFSRRHHATPFEVNAFVQDKIEFKGLVTNIGIRLDYFHTNTTQYDLHRVLEHDENDELIWTNQKLFEATQNGIYPAYQAKPKFYISPRIGFSHPLTDKSKIYFNYGHFVQVPPTMAVYTLALDPVIQRVQWMGNGEMTFEKNIAFELGYDHNLRDLFQLHIGAYYKDYHDIANGMVYAQSERKLVLEWASQRKSREIRGIEIELRKAHGPWINGWFNYNLSQRSESDLRIPFLSEVPIITDDPSKGINGEIKGIPRPDVKEIVPYARGVITLKVPEGRGPRFKNICWLENTALSLQLFYEAGKYEDHPDIRFRLENPTVRFRYLDRYWANIRLSRLFQLKVIQLELYSDMSHILHNKIRGIPAGRDKEDYFNDLFDSGRINELGTDKLTDPSILNTEQDNIYWGRFKQIVVGLRIKL